MKKIISVVMVIIMLSINIFSVKIDLLAEGITEEKKDISECTFPESLGNRPYKVLYNDLVKEGTIRILPSQKYTGEAIEPKLTILDDNYQLIEGEDYELSYEDTRKDDSSSPDEPYCGSFLNEYGNEEGPIVNVRGIGNYSGTLFFSFSILSETQKETESHLIYSEKAILEGYDGVTIDGYVGAETHVAIPDYIDGKPVQEINENAFAFHPALQKVDMSDNVYRILDGAFYHCGNLQELTLSNQLWGIGNGAFANCVSLREISLPESLEKLGYMVFHGNTSLEAFHSKSKLIYDIEGVLFRKNGGIGTHTMELELYPPAKKGETYYIPDGTQWIGGDSFRQIKNLKNIIIPQSVYHVAQGASSAFGGENAVNILFKHDKPMEEILSQNVPFSYTLAPGSTIIVKNEEMKKAAELSVTEEFKENVTVQIAQKPSVGFELTENTFTLSKGEKAQLSWTQTPEDTTENITWRSLDESIVKVDPILGTMTATGYGKCKIAGTDESGHVAEAEVLVFDPCTSHSLKIAGWTGTSPEWADDVSECTVVLGEEDIYLKAEANGYAGAQRIAFKSENENIASVRVSERNPKEAFLDIKKTGTVTITATFDNYGDSLTDHVTIHVISTPGEQPDPEDQTPPENPGIPTNKKENPEIKYKKSYKKTYGGKAFHLDVKRKKGDGTLRYSSSSRKTAVVSSKGKVTIKGTGRAVITVTSPETKKYKKKSVKIILEVSPKKQAASVKTKSGKKITVQWKKDARATGYQVHYSTDKKFKKDKKTKTIKGYKTVSQTIGKLKKGKVYYVKVRSYKNVKVNGKTKTLFGPWSSVKKSKKIR